MELILKKKWKLGRRIGGGGFGEVFAGTTEDGETAAIKMVPKAAGAERELLFVELKNVRNVVPIVDVGETHDRWVLVMPRAEKSLRQHLNEVRRPLEMSDAVRILWDILAALKDLDGKVVHRDIKPENILLLKGTWCLADFGISRYAEAATEPNTKKFALTEEYAAPERWRLERATTSTDMYSVGIVAYELCSTGLPFHGPDFRDQHLHQVAPSLVNVPPAFAGLVGEFLFKAAEARPSPANALARLERIASGQSSAGLHKLANANLVEVERIAAEGRRESERVSEQARRSALFDAAFQTHWNIQVELASTIMSVAPMASLERFAPGGWKIRINEALLELMPPSPPGNSNWASAKRPAFTVVAYCHILLIAPERDGYTGRSHSLWFCDARETGRYQWFETAFTMAPPIRNLRKQNPFHLDPSDDIARALDGGGEHLIVWPFTPLTPGDLDEFVDRWTGWFADATQGQLQHPTSIPERSPNGSWRKE